MVEVWPRVPIGRALKQVWREEAVDASVSYKILGARWYGEGLFVKDLKSGQEIQAKSVYRVEEGDFVYNRLFAWKGSFAIAAKEADGSYVSNEFPCFVVDTSVADPHFLLWFFRQESSWTQALGLSFGATPTSRNRLKEAAFLKMEIPLPPLAEQRRIVAWIEALKTQVDELRRLREQVSTEATALCQSIVVHDEQPTSTPMRELVRLRSPDVLVRKEETYQFAGVYSFGRGVFKSARKSGMDFAYPKLTRLRAGEFVYPKLMAWEGAFGTVPTDCDGCVVSPEFPVFEVNRERVLPEVLDTYFRASAVWPDVTRASTGTNVRRRRLNPKDFLDYHMPVPSKPTQLTLQKIRRETDKILRLQADTAATVDALMPAILAKAFEGTL